MLMLNFKQFLKLNTKISVKENLCNLSGLENNAVRMISTGSSAEAVCHYTFTFIAKTLTKLAENARAAHGELPIVWAGGVMSNSIIKNYLSKLGNVYFTEPQYSADNAVGVALICRKKFLNETGNRNDE